MPQLKKRQGGALLTALFIMTLVAIVATAMSTRLQTDIYRTRLMIAHDKLYLASQAVTFWSLAELANSNNKFLQPLDKNAMVAAYPKNMTSLYNQMTISGGLYDLQARFNLNNVADNKFTLAFTNLLAQVDSNSTNIERTNLTLALKNWLMAYDLAQGKDIYASYYLSQKQPYNPGHQLMSSSSEFRLVKEVTSSTFLTAEPFITVLPETTPVNINTASRQVLMSLGNGISNSHAYELMMARGDHGIEDLKKISELIKKMDLPTQQITLESSYFLSVAYVKNDEFKLVVYTLLHRSKDKKGKLSVSILRESMNTF